MNSIIHWLFGADQPLTGQNEWGFRFISDYNPYVNLLLVVVLACLVYLTVRSYRREGQASTGIKTFLAALRICVIAVVVLILFRPAIVQRISRTLHSTLIVLVDDSRSMANTDRYLSDPDYARRLSEYLKISSARLAEMPRSEIVRLALMRESGPVGKLAQDHPLMVMKFSPSGPQESNVRLLTMVDEVRPDAKQPTSAPAIPAKFISAMKSLSSGGYETNIAGAIRSALEMAQGQRLAGVVLISDGQMTAEEANSRLASARAYAEQRGVPIFTVAVGDPTPPKWVGVSALQAPREVRKDSQTEVTVLVSYRNLEGQSVTVHLEKKEGAGKWLDTGISQVIRLESAATAGAKGVQAVPLKLELPKVGDFTLRAIASARGIPESLKDKYAEAPVRVVDSKINVLLISGDSSWEFQYLRNFLQRQPELYRLSVWQQNADPQVRQSASDPVMELKQMPRDMVTLIGDKKDKTKPGYHVVILCDPQPAQGFDPTFLTALKQFVGEHSGGLCYIAGNKYTDAVTALAGPYKDLGVMLPVETASNIGADMSALMSDKPPEPWQARPTDYGLDHQITRLGSTAETTRNIWENLPGLYWSHPVFRIKPAARVLLSNSNPSRKTSKGDDEPLVAVHMYGKGPVVYMGTDDTWRWRPVNDGAYHRRFWNNVIAFLSTLKSQRVVITTGGDRFKAGEDIYIEVEAYDEKYKPLTAKEFVLDVAPVKGGSHQSLTLKALANREGRYSGHFKPAQTGMYDLCTPAHDVDVKRITVEMPQDEDLRPEANEETMKSIAEPRSDYFLRSYQMDELAQRVPEGRLGSIHENPIELWDRPLLLVVLVVLLAWEWIFRKKYNMA